MRAGIGARAPHYRQLLSGEAQVAWIEVHSENFMVRGGQPLHFLEKLRARYPLSLHGVGMSLGSAGGLSLEHLAKLKNLVERFEPELVSDHLCWGAIAGRHLNDLLPLPYTAEALEVVCRNVEVAQEFLRGQMLVENVSSYLQYADSSIPEWEFLAEVARRTGCGLLLDVNNIYVSASNHGFDALRYLDAMPQGAVQEIHLAGFDSNGSCLIDTHGNPVAGPVWNLYGEALSRLGPVPTLIEWDTDLPSLNVLLEEASIAQGVLDQWITEEPDHAIAA
ncbi:MAG: DUF692 domain-containing protein [Burkholderiales bacterium]